MPQITEREWTLMFYFASDNPLAPGIVTQLKAIKQAGFHQEVNVIAQFDPQPEGTPTHIFDVNLVNKLKNPTKTQIGFSGLACGDPFVSNLIEDKLWRDQVDRDGQPIKDRLKDSLARKLNIVYEPQEPPPDRKEAAPDAWAAGNNGTSGNNGNNHRTEELDPKESLDAFLMFCRNAYPARHYILFILGHGVVVGNDIFLFDENADKQSLSLKDLSAVLNKFKTNLNPGAEFELVSFHSCSVSSLEVAYELRDEQRSAGNQCAANYMLASQGPAFVGSWPYRQILMRVFKDSDAQKALEGGGASSEEIRGSIKGTIDKIFSYCFFNSTDFLLAGYSFDVCLCDLNKVTEIKGPLTNLSEVLQAGLDDDLVKNFILLAHLESQSQWQESYTDLCDFCFCLKRQCEKFMDRLKQNLDEEDVESMLGDTHKAVQDIILACGDVMEQLKEEAPGGSGSIIVRTDVAGPANQYSHGLSVYFPWSEPLSDRPFLDEYKDYKFSLETHWVDFLRKYFEKTMRKSRKTEGDELMSAAHIAIPQPDADEELAEDLASLIFNGDGRLSSENALNSKVNPPDPTGDECTCPTIKNYPRDTRARRLRQQSAAPAENALPVDVNAVITAAAS